VSTLDDLKRIKAAISQVIHGKDEVIDLLLIGILSGGHVLIEDIPGVGKTTLAKALSRVFAVSFARVQFTPDLLPTDILGAQVLNPKEGTLSFHRGPVFTNVLLADEINRASPRTQSALLESMSEFQVTVDGVTYPLPQPFFVLATQNPADSQGTYPLPEAQLDRFLLRIGVGYPAEEAELRMLYAQQRGPVLAEVVSVADGERLCAMQAEVREVEVRKEVASYLLRIVARTRNHPDLDRGISPRGALALFRAAQARAVMQGRAYVSPKDVQALCRPVLAHRLLLTAAARYGGATAEALIDQVVRTVDVPT
jgi:MoxR-like ATPase